MSPRHALPMRLACFCLVALLASGCSGTGGQTSADCSDRIRVDGVVYTSMGMVERPASRYASAERADCEDFGRDARGSVFPEDPDEVATWTFEGYSPAKVLGVKYGEDLFGVYLADSVPAADSERIYADVSRDRN